MCAALVGPFRQIQTYNNSLTDSVKKRMREPLMAVLPKLPHNVSHYTEDSDLSWVTYWMHLAVCRVFEL